MLKQQLDQDLKSALLAGEKARATTLRGLKSVILYAEVAQSARDKGLSDEEIVALFAKEVKKRQESADFYKQGGADERAAAELAEKAIIEKYLPKQLSDTELSDFVSEVISDLGAAKSPQLMGQVIAEVKRKTAGQADGGRIARIVKERLSE